MFLVVHRFGRIEFRIRGRSQTTLTRFRLFLTTYPPPLTFSMVWMLTKSWYFCTIYLPCLVNVVCEQPRLDLRYHLDPQVCSMVIIVIISLALSVPPALLYEGGNTLVCVKIQGLYFFVNWSLQNSLPPWLLLRFWDLAEGEITPFQHWEFFLKV